MENISDAERQGLIDRDSRFSEELTRLRTLRETCKAVWVDDVGWTLPFFTYMGEDSEYENVYFQLEEWIERRRAAAYRLGAIHGALTGLVDAVDSLNYCAPEAQEPHMEVINDNLKTAKNLLALVNWTPTKDAV